MRIGLALIFALSVIPLIPTVPAAAQEKKQQSSKEKKAQAKSQTSSLTGCVDQQDGHYVLINGQSGSFIASLEAEGFPTEGFAKHVGHKVTVRGTASPSGTERPVFKVRAVETVSDACVPELH